MRETIRRWFRLRCRYYMGEGPVIYSVTNPDKYGDGEVVEGKTITVRAAVTCHRLRWHPGKHKPW